MLNARQVRRGLVALLGTAGLAAPAASTAVEAPTAATAGRSVVLVAAVDDPGVLAGDSWLRHHREDLMPYWDLPEALGEPTGNFPSFRGRNGELLPGSTSRGLSTLARQVYGYSLAFMLTGEDRYLTYAKAGLDWIDTHAKDPVHGGYYGELDVNGDPVNPQANKDLFGLASLGLAYGMYFNVTRDPAAEAGLLAVRDLIFDKYYDATQNRMKDSLTFDLATEVDTGGNGGDITNLLVPATAISLPNAALLSDPARRAQFEGDLRLLTEILIARHKNTTATNPANRFWFWGRTARFGMFNSAQTDFGHNIKTYELILNANNLLADRPWDALSTDRETLLNRAWDDAASRWNERIRNFVPGNVEPDSGWWIHDEADQTLAALDLAEGFTRPDRTERLARSAQTFLDVYVDRDPAYPARETFARVERTGLETDLRKSFFGKSMLHNHEHALIMYLHGRALEDQPARLYYAFPADQALDLVAKPYWFDAAGESRTVTRDVTTLPGHRVVEVEFSGIGAAAREPYPAPEDTAPPTTSAAVSPDADANGWHHQQVTVDLTATDDVVGVKEIHVQRVDRAGLTRDTAVIEPGDHATVTLDAEGDHEIRYFAVDLLGNREPARSLRVRLDRTVPVVSGLPSEPCVIWPPDKRMVTIADVEAIDALSGLARLRLSVSSDEPTQDDVVVDGGTVQVRADRDGHGDGRTYTVLATATDVAGNNTTRRGSCTVPHDRGAAQP
ncbi:MAG: AGE family epimerase/isomerase [Nocardioides sp.]